ncbi:MAG: hypothetical protein EXQ90_03360 [Rhodospirillales bacterium]|nr:hypothetical protein [Rhodospirillales bacterium]
MRLNHRGLLLVALKPDPVARYDTALLEAAPAIEALKTAIDLLYAKSPGSVAAIETFKANGNVLLVYEPAFPDAKMISSNRVAAFFPDFYRKDGSANDFLVQVGRHGINWPADELAGIIVHELVGHGIQHLKGRLEGVREIDLECEAELYREQAHQDLNVDKTSPVMVRFRRALENQWCPDFRRYLAKEKAALVPLWDQLNPDIKQLLAAFEPYVGALLASGVAGNAIAAARRIQDADFDKNVRKPAEDGSAAAQNNLGIRYRDGVGVEHDLA